MRMHRFGGGAAALPVNAANFPGIEIAEPATVRGRLISGSVALALHAAAILGLLIAAWLLPDEVEETIFQLTRIQDNVVKQEPAPAPRVIAEARTSYNPAPMAVPAQIRSPAVIQRAAPVVQARKLEMASVATVKAPREVQRAARVVEHARAFQSQVQVTTSPLEVEADAPAIRGPVEATDAGAVRAGPRQVTDGNTVGSADLAALGTGSSVKDGIASNRDVLGGKTGVRAQVNWAVGDGNLRGSGGDGTGPGGITWSDCIARPEVRAYMERIRARVMARWALPPSTRGNQSVKLRFTLDRAGTASAVGVVKSEDPVLGKSAQTALRSASPFDHMTERVRCLAGQPISATFRNPTVANR
jgi:hypothetical protein